MKKSLWTGFGAYAFIFVIAGLFLGFLGLTVILGVTVVVPMLFGLASASNGQTLTERWRNASRGSKIGLGVFLLLMIPFILVAFLWLLIVGVSLWIDLLFLIPSLLIIAYLYTTRFVPKESRGFLSNAFSWRPVFLVAVIVLLVVLIASGWGYASQLPDVNRGNDGGTGSGVGSNETVGTDVNGNATDPSVLPQTSVKICVLDEFFSSSNTVKNLAVDDFVGYSDNETHTMQLNGTIGTGYPVSHVKITVLAYDLETGGRADMVQYTDNNGMAWFKNLTIGEWDFIAERSMYRQFTGNFTITEEIASVTYNEVEELERDPDITVHLTPVIYKVRVTYSATPEYVHDEGSWDGYMDDVYYDPSSGLTGLYFHHPEWEEWQGKIIFDNYTFGMNVTVTGQFIGGISEGDFETSTRHEDWYGWTQLPIGGGNQMFVIKNQIQSMFNQIVGSMAQFFQEIDLPAFRYGGVVKDTENRLVLVGATELYYMGHQYRIAFSTSDSGESVYVAPLPTNNTLSNRTFTTTDGEVTLALSTLQYREIEFAVFSTKPTANESIYIGVEFFTYFNVWSENYIPTQFSYREFPYLWEDVTEDEVLTDQELGDVWAFFMDEYQYVEESSNQYDMYKVDRFVLVINDEIPTQTAQDFHFGSEGDELPAP